MLHTFTPQLGSLCCEESFWFLMGANTQKHDKRGKIKLSEGSCNNQPSSEKEKAVQE